LGFHYCGNTSAQAMLAGWITNVNKTLSSVS
jgi:hypothetical protein